MQVATKLGAHSVAAMAPPIDTSTDSIAVQPLHRTQQQQSSYLVEGVSDDATEVPLCADKSQPLLREETVLHDAHIPAKSKEESLDASKEESLDAKSKEESLDAYISKKEESLDAYISKLESSVLSKSRLVSVITIKAITVYRP